MRVTVTPSSYCSYVVNERERAEEDGQECFPCCSSKGRSNAMTASEQFFVRFFSSKGYTNCQPSIGGA